MSFHKLFCILTLSATVLATPAMALNPQPLPPGMRFHAAVSNHDFGAARPNGGAYVLRCHAVQFGDPRKQPPMRVCP